MVFEIKKNALDARYKLTFCFKTLYKVNSLLREIVLAFGHFNLTSKTSLPKNLYRIKSQNCTLGLRIIFFFNFPFCQ